MALEQPSPSPGSAQPSLLVKHTRRARFTQYSAVAGVVVVVAAGGAWLQHAAASPTDEGTAVHTKTVDEPTPIMGISSAPATPQTAKLWPLTAQRNGASAPPHLALTPSRPTPALVSAVPLVHGGANHVASGNGDVGSSSTHAGNSAPTNGNDAGNEQSPSHAGNAGSASMAGNAGSGSSTSSTGRTRGGNQGVKSVKDHGLSNSGAGTRGKNAGNSGNAGRGGNRGQNHHKKNG
jgi:hypothetical protein